VRTPRVGRARIRQLGAARRLLRVHDMHLLVTFGAVAVVLLAPALVMWAHTLPRNVARPR